MQATEQIMELVFPPEISPASFNWNFLSSTFMDSGSADVFDRYFESPPCSPAIDASHPCKSSDSDITETSIHDDLFSLPVTNDSISGHSSISSASSVHSDEGWNAEVTTTEVADLPSNTAESDAHPVDRRHRRREQNRKAQSNFRQKKKEEIRSLQREVEELRAQLADLHKRGPTANLTICTRCRTFYPASGPAKLHSQHLQTEPGFFG
ncbi:hypothetical protein H2200_009981 [Cladophialophora chaetospira]|uniref:BZIP domain-containing protein n=1 Tax=Cladophialophora chaetospira TaxID=386627 RepID=A0AA38X1Z1_9EURO|nr:hypothetical protein H2200_009981 [Cladophialophora chaetospira]